MDHTRYDTRRYPIVDVREGYGEWVRTYEQTVHEAWLRKKPKWAAYAGLPIRFAMAWRKRQAGQAVQWRTGEADGDG